ncbi:hypothetical protein [Teredinibacter turnerae]|uniref:hypothetical protein n=1 Tax=Teredinibacter turnerae TaxID=2426 RepID=UPI0005F787AB|nr:hypothetical protein [Teredinibacter turnerae]
MNHDHDEKNEYHQLLRAYSLILSLSGICFAVFRNFDEYLAAGIAAALNWLCFGRWILKKVKNSVRRCALKVLSAILVFFSFVVTELFSSGDLNEVVFIVTQGIVTAVITDQLFRELKRRNKPEVK